MDKSVVVWKGRGVAGTTVSGYFGVTRREVKQWASVIRSSFFSDPDFEYSWIFKIRIINENYSNLCKGSYAKDSLAIDTIDSIVRIRFDDSLAIDTIESVASLNYVIIIRTVLRWSRTWFWWNKYSFCLLIPKFWNAHCYSDLDRLNYQVIEHWSLELLSFSEVHG